MQYLYYVLLGVVSYFIGNFSSARFISHLKHGDITKSGSGNPGTLNMWRAYGFWPGIVTFLLDMVKGILPTLFGYLVFPLFNCSGEIALYVAGFCVILGHIFPVVYKFKGGKGIATAIGVFLVANWWVALIVFVIMVVCMLFIKYASVLTIGFVITMSIVEICLTNPLNWINYIFISGILLLILYAHRANIKRLFTGKENKTELLSMVKKIFTKKKTETEPTTSENSTEQSENSGTTEEINTCENKNSSKNENK